MGFVNEVELPSRRFPLRYPDGYRAIRWGEWAQLTSIATSAMIPSTGPIRSGYVQLAFKRRPICNRSAWRGGRVVSGKGGVGGGVTGGQGVLAKHGSDRRTNHFCADFPNPTASQYQAKLAQSAVGTIRQYSGVSESYREPRAMPLKLLL